MKITINDPMPGLRMKAVEDINQRFNEMAFENLHRDAAHAQKRQWAINQDNRLFAEAELRGISIAELATLILSKPDALAERELRRQKALARVASAKTPDDLVNVDI